MLLSLHSPFFFFFSIQQHNTTQHRNLRQTNIMDAGYNPRTVEEVFRDFKGRRAALIKALTTGSYHFPFQIFFFFFPLLSKKNCLFFCLASLMFVCLVLFFVLFLACLIELVSVWFLQMLKSSTSSAIPVTFRSVEKKRLYFYYLFWSMFMLCVCVFFFLLSEYWIELISEEVQSGNCILFVLNLNLVECWGRGIFELNFSKVLLSRFCKWLLEVYIYIYMYICMCVYVCIMFLFNEVILWISVSFYY